MVLTPTVYHGDEIVRATLSFVVLWTIVALVQCIMAVRIICDPDNAPRRSIFGTLLGGIMFLVIAYGSRIGQNVLDYSNGGLSSDIADGITFYALNLIGKSGYSIVYISTLLVTYKRIKCYVAPSSSLWLIKRVVDGFILGVWALVYIFKIFWRVAADVAISINHTISEDEYNLRLDTSRSLQSAVDSFFIIIEVTVIVGILMLSRTSTSRGMRDYVVRTLILWVLPVLVFRTIWNIIATALNDTPSLIPNGKPAESLNLVDWIIDDFLAAAITGAMIRLGSQKAFWAAPTTPPPHGAVPHLPHGEQGPVGEVQEVHQSEKVQQEVYGVELTGNFDTSQY